MSAVADRVLSVTKPVDPSAAFIPLMGGLWVLTNVVLGGLGVYIHWPVTCAFVAGLVNGTLLSGIAVATASERFQAGTTGLLGGFTLSALRSDGSMVWNTMQGLHIFIDHTFKALGFVIDERLHQAIEQETLYMIWTVILVVLASLVAEWVRSTRAKADA